MNQNPHELEFFSQQAEDWWSTDQGAAALLHQINPPRLRFITQEVDLKGKTCLDVGCGGGILTEALAKSGAITSGLDLAAPLIKVAQEHAEVNQLNINYYCEAAEAFAEKNQGAFDIITCMEMLEHVPDPESIIKAISTMLKPGGYVFLSTIDRSPKSFFKVILGAEYILRMLPRGTHHYQQFIRPGELSRALRNQGLDPIKSGGLKFNPFMKTFTLVPHPTENYLLCARK